MLQARKTVVLRISGAAGDSIAGALFYEMLDSVVKAWHFNAVLLL